MCVVRTTMNLRQNPPSASASVDPRPHHPRNPAIIRLAQAITARSARRRPAPTAQQLLDIDMQLADWPAAVDFARTLPELDPDRIALWGKSFGVGHVIEPAARLPGIAAAVAQCPFTDGLASIGAVNPLTAIRNTSLALRDLYEARRRRPFSTNICGPPAVKCSKCQNSRRHRSNLCYYPIPAVAGYRVVQRGSPGRTG